MNDKLPFFSVIIPAYNREHFLRIAIDSVLYQTWQDYELIIVDDGSTDQTSALVSGVKTVLSPDMRARVRYVYQDNAGPAAARNTGIRCARGLWIAFLDSDDRWLRDKLSVVARAIGAYPAISVFHTQEIWYRNGALLPQKSHHKKPHGDVFAQMCHSCCIGVSTVVMRAQVFAQAGMFNEEFLACEDYELWLRVSQRYVVFLVSQWLTIKEGGHMGQQSKKYEAMDSFRIRALALLLEHADLTRQQYAVAARELTVKTAIYVQGCRKRGKIREAQSAQKALRAHTPHHYV